MNLKSAVIQRALELGFDDCRFTSAQPPVHAGQFQQWLQDGRHGQMEYLARNAYKRTDPAQVLAGAKTIITLAVSYAKSSDVGARDETEHRAGMAERPAASALVPSPREAVRGIEQPIICSDLRRGLGRGEPPLPGPLLHKVVEEREKSSAHPTRLFQGEVARYARYKDYHDVMGHRLKELARLVDSLVSGTRSLWYVDTGPLLERDLAERSGLGFIGKHTNLISRKLGNWIFLAEIITTLALEADAPAKNHCGSCRRCLDACPTAAITAPFQLDARRCISYLTIELKGAIPEELRPMMGRRIYGCDDCLAVCPWNRFAKEGAMMRPHGRGDLAAPDLLELLSLDEAAFARRFAGTPIRRIKRRGLLRNVCVALGNIGDETALAALERAATDSEPLVAEHARWAIGRIRARIG